MYEAALSAERARYDALLEQRRTASSNLEIPEPKQKGKVECDG